MKLTIKMLSVEQPFVFEGKNIRINHRNEELNHVYVNEEIAFSFSNSQLSFIDWEYSELEQLKREKEHLEARLKEYDELSDVKMPLFNFSGKRVHDLMSERRSYRFNNFIWK